MIARFALLALLWASPWVHGVPRSVNLAIASVDAAIERRNPWRAVVELDVFSSLETANGDADVAGGCPGVRPGTPCKRGRHARYCGPWMVLCSRVPVGATLLDEARIALDILEESRAFCPAHPYGRFIGDGCRASHLEDVRAAAIEREVAR